MGWFFKDKIVFISGSGSGIGKATAISFAKQGAKVIINGCNEQKIKEATRELKNGGYDVDAFVADISEENACKDLKNFILTKYGRLDIFIANAGLSSKDLFENTEPSVFRKIVQNNVFSVSTPFYYFYPLLKKTQGSFVLINSVAAIQGLPTSAAYSVSKMAIRAFAQSIEPEIQSSGVHIGSIYFGFIQNDDDKTTYSGDGKAVSVPKRRFAIVSKEKASESILYCCKKRKRSMHVTTLAKIIFLFSRLSPSLLNYLIRKNMHRLLQAQKLHQ